MSYMKQGFGDYERTPYNWTSIFNSYGQYLPAREMGLGCAACQGQGVGVFDSGFDLSGWGVTEWLIIAAGLYVAKSVFSQAKRNVSSVRKYRRRAQKKASLKKQLKQQLSAL